MNSLAASIALLPEPERRKALAEITEEQAKELLYEWRFWARPAQVAPSGNWTCWLILAGRGYGKTRAGSQWVDERVRSGNFRRIGLIAETSADARDVLVEGTESGILAISKPDFRPKYEPSKRRLTWPNGAVATTYSGDEPDQLRGPQHDTVWADEPAKWKYPQKAWDNMELGLRIGPKPQVCATTTPKPIPLIRALVKDADTVVTRGNSYENIPNLAPAFIRRIIKRYEGTRLGRQELHAELLEDAEGALWKRALIDKLRVMKHPELTRLVVGVDPAASSEEESNETGIIVAGLGEEEGWVLDDCSLRGSPGEWAAAVVTAYHKFKADKIVAEVNNGGEMVAHTIHTADPTVYVEQIHASRGKRTRAEPVAALYEQGRIHHVGNFGDLEDQMCNWTPGDDSPDRMDALVWCFTDLMVGQYYGDLGIIRIDQKDEELTDKEAEERQAERDEELREGDLGWES